VLLVWYYLLLQFANACSVCSGGANPVVAKTYFDITLLMSFLPMSIIGGGILYYMYKHKQIKHEDP
jgi:hypothetical protein